MKVNLLFRRLAQDSGDYPIPVADAAERLPELRPETPKRANPADAPTHCCDSCEHLTGLIREFGGVRQMDAATAAWFEQQMEAIHR